MKEADDSQSPPPPAPQAPDDSNPVEILAAWMIKNGFATGHGESLEALLAELEWQVDELSNAKRL